MAASVNFGTQQYFGFDPRTIPGCQLWHDAADSNTFTLASGSVTAWRNKASTTSAVATANIPVTFNANGLGTGYPALEFPATTTWLEGAVGISGTSSLSVFSVFSMSASSAFAARLLSLAATNVPDYNTTAYVGILRQSSTNMGPFRNFGYAGASTPYDTRLLNTSFVEGTTLSGATNGGTAVTAGTSTANFSITAYRVGNTLENADTGAGRFQGFIGEVIAYNTSLTLFERQQVEGYLAHKWGLRASLPAIHPFSVRPVTNRVFRPVDILGCGLWLDGADQRCVIVSPGTSNVLRWEDKSGNGIDATVSETAFATYSQSGLTFNNSYYTTSYPGNPTNETLFIVFNKPVLGTNTQAAIGGITGGRGIDIGASGTSASRFQVTNINTTIGSTTGDGSIVANTPTIGVSQITGQLGRVQLNGGTFAIAGGILSFTAGRTTDLGRANGINGYVGIIYEVIIYNRSLSTSERHQIEGYLAEKWNLQSALPTTHPYRFRVLPSTTLFTPQSIEGLQVWTDASTLTEASGTALSTWANGGSFGTVNCTGTVQREQLNQLPVVRFTTAQRWAPASTLNLSSYTLCFVTRLTSIPIAPSGRVLRHVVNGTNNQLYGYWQGFKGSWFVDGANTNAGLFTQLADTQWDLCTHTRTAGGASLFRWNGVEFFRRTSSSGSGMAGLQINPTGDSENTACEVAEIFVYNSVLPFSQLQVIEGYLATKWGIQSRIAIYSNPLLPPFLVPLALSDARIWVDASTLTQANGVALTTWPNIALGGGGPTINCTGVVFTNQLNGKRVVRFTTAQTWTTSPLINYSSYTLMFVARLTGGTNRRVFVTNTTNQLFGYWNGFKRAIYGDGAFGPTQLETVPADTSWDIITLTRVSGGAFTFRWNGNLLFSGSASPGVGLAGLAINAGAFGAESSTCEVAEVIVVDSVLPSSQIIGMEEYLSFTWGIPISRRHGYSLFRA